MMPVFQQVLSVLTQQPAGLITDIDGTLSPIAPSPELARVSTACKSYLRKLSPKLALVATVSGRSALDARALVGVDSLVYVGNHGLEELRGEDVSLRCGVREYRPQLAAVLQRVVELTHGVAGIIVEDKGSSASVHYRQATDQEGTRRQLLNALDHISEAQGLKITEGKMVVELRPPVPVNKGTAVLDLVDRYALSGVVYFGDDFTDVDAFQALAQLKRRPSCSALAVAVVGPDTAEQIYRHADACVQGVQGVEALLGCLAQEQLTAFR
jgi:trehalose 6-phosphate phosphatase